MAKVLRLLESCRRFGESRNPRIFRNRFSSRLRIIYTVPLQCRRKKGNPVKDCPMWLLFDCPVSDALQLCQITPNVLF